MVHYRFLLPAFININPNYYMLKYAYFQVFSIFGRLLNHHQSAFKLYLKLCTPLVLIIHNYRLNLWLSKRGLFLNNPLWLTVLKNMDCWQEIIFADKISSPWHISLTNLSPKMLFLHEKSSNDFLVITA